MSWEMRKARGWFRNTNVARSDYTRKWAGCQRSPPAVDNRNGFSFDALADDTIVVEEETPFGTVALRRWGREGRGRLFLNGSGLQRCIFRQAVDRVLELPGQGAAAGDAVPLASIERVPAAGAAQYHLGGMEG